jgi:hypothetical protein
MKTIVLRIGVGVLVICILLVGLVAVALPRLINSDDFRATLHKGAADALGAPVEWKSLEAGLFPPRLTINAPVLLASTAESEDARVTAESIDLRLAFLPILASRLELDSLVLRGVELVVTRTPSGFILPIPSSASADPVAKDAEESIVNYAVVSEGEVAVGGLDLALRRVVISDSRVLVRDKTSPHQIEWRFEELEMEARPGSESGELAIELAAVLEAGPTRVGRVRTTGMLTLAGAYDLELEIEKWLLAELQSSTAHADAAANTAANTAENTTVAGTLSGKVSVEGEASAVSKFEIDLRIDELGVRTGDVGLTTDGETRVSGDMKFGDDDRIDVDLGLAFADGARLDVKGNASRAGGVDLRAEAESLDLAFVRPFLPDATMELAGRATGDGHWVGKIGSPDLIEADLAVAAGLVRTEQYFLEGPFQVRVEAKDPLSERPHGRIDLDLTQARLDYAGQFQKPVGMRAEMTTRFVTDDAGEITFESSVKFRDINEILLRGALGDSTSIALTASKVELEGWSEIVPALAPFHLDGTLSFDAFGIETGDESSRRFLGRIDLQGVGLEIDGSNRIEIEGAIVAVGDHVRAEEIRLQTARMTVGINGRVMDPLRSARFDFTLASIGPAEVNDLLSAYTSNPDTLFGPLRFAGRFEGAASSETDLYHSIVGKLDFTVGEEGGGRLQGISILKTVIDEIPLLGGAVLLTKPFRNGRSVDDYFTEQFEILEGNFEVSNGKVNAKKLRIAYKGYEAMLSGPIRLRDLEIDMTGEILLKDDLVSALGGLTGAELDDRGPIRIPLARVTNTLVDPKIEMTPATLAAVPKLLLQGTGLDTVVIGVGKSLSRLLGGGEK